VTSSASAHCGGVSLGASGCSRRGLLNPPSVEVMPAVAFGQFGSTAPWRVDPEDLAHRQEEGPGGSASWPPGQRCRRAPRPRNTIGPLGLFLFHAAGPLECQGMLDLVVLS
jgi:hypothetical protein